MEDDGATDLPTHVAQAGEDAVFVTREMARDGGSRPATPPGATAPAARSSPTGSSASSAVVPPVTTGEVDGGAWRFLESTDTITMADVPEEMRVTVAGFCDAGTLNQANWRR